MPRKNQKWHKIPCSGFGGGFGVGVLAIFAFGQLFYRDTGSSLSEVFNVRHSAETFTENGIRSPMAKRGVLLGRNGNGEESFPARTQSSDHKTLKNAAIENMTPTLRDDYLIVAGLGWCRKREDVTIIASACELGLPLTIVHPGIDSECQWIATLQPPLRHAVVRSPSSWATWPVEDANGVRVASYVKSLGTLPKFILIVDPMRVTLARNPLVNLQALGGASTDASLLVQDKWVALHQSRQTMKNYERWGANQALQAKWKNAPVLSWGAWGGAAGVVAEMLQEASHRMREAEPRLHSEPAGFPALLADYARGANPSGKALPVIHSFANVDSDRTYTMYMRPEDANCPTEDCSCTCTRLAEGHRGKSIHSLMNSSDGVRWNVQKLDINVGPYVGFGEFPIACRGCPLMSVYVDVKRVKLQSDTDWGEVLSREFFARKTATQLVITTVLGICDSSYHSGLVKSSAKYGIRLMVLHDQPRCASLTTKFKTVEFVLIDGSAYSHIPDAVDRAYMFIDELLDVLFRQTNKPDWILMVHASDTLFAGDPFDYFIQTAGTISNPVIFAQGEDRLVRDADDVKKLFHVWKVNSDLFESEKVLHFGAWGGSSKNIQWIFNTWRNKLDQALFWMTGKEHGMEQAIFNEVLRTSWLDFKVDTGFVNPYWGAANSPAGAPETVVLNRLRP